jgi:outer membrane receptor protein involved in Fe transport
MTEANVSPYAQNTVQWTDWLRTVSGLRGDWYQGSVTSDTPANSGMPHAFITSPKLGVVVGPFAKTELFFDAGNGFHSNDLRGATISVDPNDKVTPQNKVPLLVRSTGAEVGLRSKAVDNLESSVALFVLDFDSELQFEGDLGTTVAGRPSRRTGLEWTNIYKPLAWLSVEADLALSRARFTNFDVVGNRIPGAPGMVASTGITVGERTGWFGAAKLRYLGPTPLIEDDSVRSHGAAIVNASAGYRFDNGYRLQLDALNLFNTKAHQIDYYYASRLPGEPLDGIADVHFKPVEPLAVRLTLAGRF